MQARSTKIEQNVQAFCSCTTMASPGPGDFSFVITPVVRAMLEDAYQAVTKTESWSIIGQDPGMGGFGISIDEKILRIRDAMEYKDHNSSSRGWTLRQMQIIANRGWENYVNRVEEGQTQ